MLNQTKQIRTNFRLKSNKLHFSPLKPSNAMSQKGVGTKIIAELINKTAYRQHIE